MRVSIVLVIAFLGVASASSLAKRNLFEAFHNKTQEAVHNFEHFGQDFQNKLQDAFKNLFGNKNSTDAENREKRGIFSDFQEKWQDAIKNLFGGNSHADDDVEETSTEAVVVAKRESLAEKLFEFVATKALENAKGRKKRSTNPLTLLNELDNPAAFTQTLMKVLADMAMGQGRRKRDLSNPLKIFGEQFGEKYQKELEQALKNLFNIKDSSDSEKREKRGIFSNFQEKWQDAIKNLFGGNSHADDEVEETSTEAVVVAKRESLAEKLFDIVATKALENAKGRKKRATNAVEAIIKMLSDPSQWAEKLYELLASKAVEGRNKRDLAEDLKKFAEDGKQRAQDAIQHLKDLFNSFKNGGANPTESEKTVAKRDINEDLKKLAEAGKEKIEAALKQLQGLFESFKGGFNHDQESKTVTKRDIMESLKQFRQSAQEKTQAAFSHLKDALSGLLKGMPSFNKPEAEEETSTEVTVSKRSFADFHEKTQEALSGFKNAFSNFFNHFRKPAAQEPVEDTTESS